MDSVNKIKKVLHKQLLAKFKYSRSVQFTGVSFQEYCDYFYSNYGTGESIRNSVLFGKPIKRNNTFWFVQNVEEVFVDEVYKFVSNSERPYIIDCGSNIGLSIIYFKKHHPNAEILGFEPDSIVFKTCQYNLKSFGFDNISVLNAAVWKEDGFINFLPDNCLGGKIVGSGGEDEVTSKEATSKIEAIRLKKYLNRKVDFLKIDIEGAELEVLRDCREDLKWVENLFVEYHGQGNKPQDLQELLSIMSDSGFRYYVDSAWQTMAHPFIDHTKHKSSAYDLQLNIFAYRG